MKKLADRAARLLADELVSFETFSGGDLSPVMRIRLASGRSAVAKSGPASFTEAEMLDAIRASGAPAPEVLAVDADVLVLQDFEDDAGLTGAWGSLGNAVRTLHACTGPSYGWRVDFRFGPVPIPNGMGSDWPRFWAERRLLASLTDVPTALARRIETLCGKLADRLPANPRPALLHGDLWVGNIIADQGRIRGLIDPACYYGHSEADLAMLCLFVRPDETFWQAYGVAPEPGFEERRPIYQLWPALVHLRLFGDSYHGLVERLLDSSGC